MSCSSMCVLLLPPPLRAHTRLTRRHWGQVLAVNEFTSTRKRMSVLVRQDNQYILMAKGADNVMFERILSVPQEQRVRHCRHAAAVAWRA